MESINYNLSIRKTSTYYFKIGCIQIDRNSFHTTSSSPSKGSKVIDYRSLFPINNNINHPSIMGVHKDSTHRIGYSISRFKLIYAKVTRQIVSLDRKSTRLNSSHVSISYAVLCLIKNT